MLKASSMKLAFSSMETALNRGRGNPHTKGHLAGTLPALDLRPLAPSISETAKGAGLRPG